MSKPRLRGEVMESGLQHRVLGFQCCARHNLTPVISLPSTARLVKIVIIAVMVLSLQLFVSTSNFLRTFLFIQYEYTDRAFVQA